MAEKILQDFRQELLSGVSPDGEEDVGAFWLTADNTTFTPLGVSKMAGWEAAFTPTDSNIIHGMFQYQKGVDSVLYYGDKAKLFKWVDSTLTTEGTGYTGNDDAGETIWDSGSTTWDSDSTTWDGGGLLSISSWSFTNFGDWVFATNGKDAPQVDKGSGFIDVVGLSTIATTAHHVAKLGPYILFFDTDVNDREGIWCDTDDPDTWIPTSANAAGSLVIRELDSPVKAVVPLGNQLAIFGRNSMFLWRFIGAPLYFGYQQVFGADVGAISKKAVASSSRKLYTMTENDFVVTDGVSAESIATDEIIDHVFTDINRQQTGMVTSFHDEANKIVRWWYPSLSSSVPDKGVAYNYETGAWTTYSHGKTAALPKEMFDYPFTADENGNIFYERKGNDADTSALTAEVESKPLDLGSPEVVKHLTKMRLSQDGTGLQFRFGYSDDVDGTYTYTDWANAPTDKNVADIRLTGRYIKIGMRSTALGDTWEIDRIILKGFLGGER